MFMDMFETCGSAEHAWWVQVDGVNKEELREEGKDSEERRMRGGE
jgi:hypothetical protein